MKTLKICIGLLALTLLNACDFGQVKTFTSDDIKWFKPYGKTETIIFESVNGETDTIIFHKTDTTKYSIKDIEQGFYNKTTLSVAYEFTKGSYHQFAKTNGENKRYEQNILSISNSSSSEFTEKEITFIGIFFNGKEMENIKQLDSSTYFFDSNKATYPEINVEKGIRNFTFDTEKGIIKYTDNRNINWTRK
jgi:hypothetical protein